MKQSTMQKESQIEEMKAEQKRNLDIMSACDTNTVEQRIAALRVQELGAQLRILQEEN